MDKRKVLLTAAIAGLFAAGVVNQTTPAFADEHDQGHAVDKASCKGGSCKGEETKAAGAEGEKAAAPAKKGGKHKAKHHKKKKADAPAS